MIACYNARGNVYAVAAPDEVGAVGVSFPATAREAAQAHFLWARLAVDAFCGSPRGGPGSGAKLHATDGFLIGPFQDQPPFDLLIVNTDGTLAERSGNGLTIFSRALADRGLLRPDTPVLLRVHHNGAETLSPTITEVQVVLGPNDEWCFWIDLGTPLFGPAAAGARGRDIQAAGDGLSCVARLAEMNADWNRSVFVRIGNPHCVTLVADPDVLPSMEEMRTPAMHANLVGIAYGRAQPGTEGVGGHGDPCPEGGEPSMGRGNFQGADRRQGVRAG